MRVKTVKMILTLTLTLFIAPSGCSKKGESGGSADPAATAGNEARAVGSMAPTGLDLSIAVQNAAEVSVPNASIEVAKEPTDLATFKKSLAEDELGTVVEDKTLSDGWMVRYKGEDNLIATTVQRKLGSRTIKCVANGESQAELDHGKVTCLAMASPGGTQLVIPFKMSKDDYVSVTIGDVNLKLAQADEDVPATAKAAFKEVGWRRTGKLTSEASFKGGFAFTYRGHNGDLASNGVLYGAMVRTKLGQLDLVCKPLSTWTKSGDDAKRVVEHCRALRSL